MQGLKSKAAAVVVAALLGTLPADEGGVQGGFSKPYTDIAGVKTVCYGHTGKDIENHVCIRLNAEAVLAKALKKHLANVKK